MRIPTTLALIALIAAAGLFAGCSSDRSWCCEPGTPLPSTQAACRCGPQCVWPPERGSLEPGEVPLTPSMNRALCCPPFGDGYRYTRAPFECVNDRRRFQEMGR
ncbi:MAG: hypothetical protein QNJ98_12450 [Planctomycetota bacterium]|nr:hypothetical protein [Planctomycetota bacterium]